MNNVVINLDQHRRILKRILTAAVVKFANEKGSKIEDIVGIMLDNTIGNSIVDSELEESIFISLSQAFGLTCKSPQFELNGGHEGNGEDTYCDHEKYSVIDDKEPKICHCDDCGDNFFLVPTD